MPSHPPWPSLFTLPKSLFLWSTARNSSKRGVSFGKRELLKVGDVDKREVRGVSLFLRLNCQDYRYVRVMSEMAAVRRLQHHGDVAWIRG
jgi:hypothetical protein